MAGIAAHKSGENRGDNLPGMDPQGNAVALWQRVQYYSARA
jgi:hypothetical protein